MTWKRDFDVFNIVGRTELSRESLRRSAEELREIQRAAKAAKLAQGLTAPKKRKQRSQAKGKQKKRPLAMQDAEDLSGEDWGSESSASDRFSEEEMAADDADGGPASSSAVPALSAGRVPAARRRKQARAIPWGPFQIAPIVPSSGQTGWGAICGQHRDRGNTLSCKKAVSRGALTDAQCILRLKRWLIAGCHDAAWPSHRQRSHHVELGGKGLQDFAEGMSEAEMDALVASWV